MSHRNEVFRAIPFDASSDASEPLIAAGDAEEEDHRLEEKAFFSRFKLYSMLLGLLVGFFAYFSTLVIGTFLVITGWGEDFVTKCETDTFVYFSLLCSLIFSAIVFFILGFLRNFAAMTYSAIGGRSKDLLEVFISAMDYGFVVGTLVGISLAWEVAAALFGMRVQTVHSRVVLLVAAINATLVVALLLKDWDELAHEMQLREDIVLHDSDIEGLVLVEVVEETNSRLSPPQTNHTNFLLNIMSHRNEVFRALPFDASSDASEPLIAAGDAEEEDHGLEEKAFFFCFKLSLLLGWLVSFYFQLAFFFVETIWGEDGATKSKTGIVVLSLIWTFLSLVMVFVVWEFLRNAINYSAAGRRSKDLHLVCRLRVGALVGIYSVWIMTAVLLGQRVQIV
jgi:hypothetical protein